MAEQAREGVVAGRSTFDAVDHGCGTYGGHHPRQRNIEVDTRAGVGGDASSDLTMDESVGVEAFELTTCKKSNEEPFGYP